VPTIIANRTGASSYQDSLSSDMTQPYKPVNEIVGLETAGWPGSGGNEQIASKTSASYFAAGTCGLARLKMLQVLKETSQLALFYLSAWQY
jgi:hypothetical protein